MKRKSDKDGTPGAKSTMSSLSNTEKPTKKPRVSNKGKTKDVQKLDLEWPEYFQSVSIIHTVSAWGCILPADDYGLVPAFQSKRCHVG